jgi:hypothetical protein
MTLAAAAILLIMVLHTLMAMLKKVAVAVAEVMMTPLALVQGGHLGVVTEKVVGEDMTMMIPQAVAAAVAVDPGLRRSIMPEDAELRPRLLRHFSHRFSSRSSLGPQQDLHGAEAALEPCMG